jgi:hypothetical protein
MSLMISRVEDTSPPGVSSRTTKTTALAACAASIARES